MNKFVRQYLILPFLVCFTLFPLLFFTGCLCAQTSPGHKIITKVWKKDPAGELVLLPSHNQMIFKKILLTINRKWLFDKDLKNRSELQKKIEEQNKNKKNQDVKDFLDVAFYSSKNSRYYQAEFLSQFQENKQLNNKQQEWASEFLYESKKIVNNPRKLTVFLFFQNVDKTKVWKIKIIIENFKVSKIGFFDIGKTFQAEVVRCQTKMPVSITNC